jgi:hypothetical protein
VSTTGASAAGLAAWLGTRKAAPREAAGAATAGLSSGSSEGRLASPPTEFCPPYKAAHTHHGHHRRCHPGKARGRHARRIARRKRVDHRLVHRRAVGNFGGHRLADRHRVQPTERAKVLAKPTA